MEAVDVGAYDLGSNRLVWPKLDYQNLLLSRCSLIQLFGHFPSDVIQVTNI